MLQALGELQIKPDVMTGCSVGALVAGAHLLGILPELEKWARELSPLGALKEFEFRLSKAGVIDPQSAFEIFKPADKNIEDLSIPLGISATDLATGEEVQLTTGSVIDAARASSAIPIIFPAARLDGASGDLWLVDGALTNPVPVDLARQLGAEKIIAVDLHARSRTLDRFDPPKTRALTVRHEPDIQSSNVLPQQVTAFVNKTRSYVEEQVALAKAKIGAEPHFVETGIASLDIFQMHLSRAKMAQTTTDILLAPDLRAFPPTAFDCPDEMITLGYETTMDAKADLLALVTTA